MAQRAVTLLLLSSTLLSVAFAIDNGLGRLPPMGWRSWNCYHGDVTDPLMRKVVDAVTSRARTVAGKPTSLLDLGYSDVGLDDNWQACGKGVGGSFHDAAGNPLVNTDRFPDMKSMTDYAHSKGVTMGWYHNNCICSEHGFPDVTAHYKGDVNASVALGFDGVKLDGCGEFLNLTYWAQLLNATGRPVMIENCHWGGDLPTQDWCPFNFFRTSGDISPSWDSWFGNLQTTRKFQDPTAPLARPGCWAYPDMLEVGNMGNYNEERAHFGAWCIVSAPLILGFDLTNQAVTDRVWDIISNTEALAVSQSWNGHPGMLIKEYNPSGGDNYPWAVDCDFKDPTQLGWYFNPTSNAVSNGKLCMDVNGTSAVMMTACNDSPTQQMEHTTDTLKFTKSGDCLDVYDFQGPVVQPYACNGGDNQQFVFADGLLVAGSGQCLAVRQGDPAGGSSIQIWAKPMAKGAVAVLVINGVPTTAPAETVTFTLASVGISSTSATVRDIWNHKDLGSVTGSVSTGPMQGHDSAFYLITPQ